MGKNDKTDKNDANGKRGRPAGSASSSKDFRAYLALEKIIPDRDLRMQVIHELREQKVF